MDAVLRSQVTKLVRRFEVVGYVSATDRNGHVLERSVFGTHLTKQFEKKVGEAVKTLKARYADAYTFVTVAENRSNDDRNA